jgi:hypothetical protein
VWEGLVVGIASGFNNGIQERKKNLSWLLLMIKNMIIDSWYIPTTIGQFVELGYFSFSSVFPNVSLLQVFTTVIKNFACVWYEELKTDVTRTVSGTPLCQVGCCLARRETLQKMPRISSSSQTPSAACTLWILSDLFPLIKRMLSNQIHWSESWSETIIWFVWAHRFGINVDSSFLLYKHQCQRMMMFQAK